MWTSLGVIAPLLAALVALRFANVPKHSRQQQFLMPAVAFVFVVFALIVLYRFNAWIDRALEWLFGLIPFLAQVYDTRWLYVLENTLLVLVFFVVKYLYRMSVRPLFVGEKFAGSTLVGHFYEYEAAVGKWFVRPRFSDLRVFYAVLFWVSIVITAVLLLWQQAAPSWPGFAGIAFPALATLMIGEVWYALNGMTRAEASDAIEAEHDAASRIANYAALREVFRRTFRRRVLDEGVDLQQPFSLSSHHALDRLSKSGDSSELLFAEYFARVKQSGTEIDENLLHASLEILRGTSTLIHSPFYTDLTHYLALPSYIRQLRGGKTLIIVGRDFAADEVIEWFTRGLQTISGVPELWQIARLTQHTNYDLDVGVLRTADVHNLELLQQNDEFFREVQTVILLEPSRMVATAQLGLAVLVSRLNNGQAPVYIACDHNHDGLVDALSHLLKVSLTDVIATVQARGVRSEMVWQAEGPHLAAQILPGVARYLGVGTEIAAVALKHHVSEVEWVGGDKFPVVDMSWISGQYFAKINAFAEMELSQRALSDSFVARAHPLGVPRTKKRFMVVEDELQNVYESLRMFASRSTENGFVNLISENYLLRDYMVDNRTLFSIDPKAIPGFVPDFARTVRNTVLRLVLQLTVYGATEEAILREFSLVGLGAADSGPIDGAPVEPTAITLLRQQAELVLGLSEIFIERIEPRHPVAGAADHSVEAHYRILPQGATSELINELSSAYFLVEDEAEHRDYIGACLQGHVTQTVMPGQFLTVGGKYYEVLTLAHNGAHTEVLLRRAAEHIHGRRTYRQIRTFTLSEQRQAQQNAPVVEGVEITLERQRATIDVQTHGFLEQPRRDEFSETLRVRVPGLSARRYLAKDVLRIGVPGATPEVRRTIALLLNEMFVTTFPNDHKFIVAATNAALAEHDELLPLLHVDDDDAIYIIEDSQVDLGLLVSVERHWRRLLETVTDYLEWLHEPAPADIDTAVSPVRFADEDDASYEQRQQHIQEAEARGGYEIAQPPSLWRRIMMKIRAWFTRTPRPQAEEPDGEAERSES